MIIYHNASHNTTRDNTPTHSIYNIQQKRFACRNNQMHIAKSSYMYNVYINVSNIQQILGKQSTQTQ